MGEPVRGHDRRRAGQSQELDQQQTERPAAEHSRPAADADRRQVERMERHAERLEQGDLVVAERIRNAMEEMRPATA